MTRTELLMEALGWQGGTIHQLADVTGCDAGDLLYGQPTSTILSSPYSLGASAVRTCSREFNLRVNFPKSKGDLNFWLGVARGVELSHALGERIGKDGAEPIPTEVK